MKWSKSDRSPRACSGKTLFQSDRACEVCQLHCTCNNCNYSI